MSDTSTWLQPLKRIIWIILSPQARASYTNKSIPPNLHTYTQIQMRTATLSTRVHICQRQVD